MTNNGIERALRGIAVGRRNWTFAGSDEGGRRAAAMCTLIEMAKLNDVDPRAYLADVLAWLPVHPAKHIDELPPWNWAPAASRSLSRQTSRQVHRVRHDTLSTRGISAENRCPTQTNRAPGNSGRFTTPQR